MNRTNVRKIGRMFEKSNNVAAFLFARPEIWVHLRELSRKISVSPDTAMRQLKLLENEGIVQMRKVGNLTQYRANLESKEYRREKMLSNLALVLRSGVVGYLEECYSPQAIVLFGSFAKGEDVSMSDVDIAVLTSRKQSVNLSTFEKKIGRSISLSLLTPKEVSLEFYNSLINGIVLSGYLKK